MRSVTGDELKQQLYRKLLTEEVYKLAWRYAYRLTGNREDAEDLLQDSLAYGFEKLSSLRDQSSFRGWLLSIVRSKFIRNWHRRKRLSVVADSMPENRAAEVRDTTRFDLSAALSKLPESQQELLCLYYIDGLSLNETGQVLELEPATVKQRLFRARAALRRHLEPQFALTDMSALF